MKKICFFMDSPFTLGGEQRVVSNLANYLSKFYDVSFLLTSNDRNKDFDLYNLNKNINFYYLDSYNSIFNVFARKVFRKFRFLLSFSLFYTKLSYCNFFDKKELINIINGNEFDYIIGVASDHYSILSVLKPSLNKTKIIAWQHSTFDAYFKTKNRRLYNQDKFIKYLFSVLDYYVCQTKDDYTKIMEKFNFSSTVINNPNTFDKYLFNKNKNNTFLAVGRLVDMKNFSHTIIAFSKIHNKIPDWTLKIVGNGPEKNNLLSLISSLNLSDCVQIIDGTNKIDKYYDESKIYVMTSSWEGWGMVVTEAMQCGLAIISYDIPSSKEIFGNNNVGLLVDKGNISELSNAMLSLASNPEMLGSCSKASLLRSKDFDINYVGAKWGDIFYE